MTKKTEEISQYLKDCGINPSYQRIKVYEYMSEHFNHPTADIIYRELSKEMPTLSKTTVYNTLKFFVDKNIVTPITITEGETRYDADTSLHGHFLCVKCGGIFDFAVDISGIKTDVFDFADVNERHIYFKGVCKKDRNGKTKARNG